VIKGKIFRKSELKTFQNHTGKINSVFHVDIFDDDKNDLTVTFFGDAA
jgi:hypothetical protein